MAKNMAKAGLNFAGPALSGYVTVVLQVRLSTSKQEPFPLSSAPAAEMVMLSSVLLLLYCSLASISLDPRHPRAATFFANLARVFSVSTSASMSCVVLPAPVSWWMALVVTALSGAPLFPMIRSACNWVSSQLPIHPTNLFHRLSCRLSIPEKCRERDAEVGDTKTDSPADLRLLQETNWKESWGPS